MPFYGTIRTFKRDGTPASIFPAYKKAVLFGRSMECDIRVTLPYVSAEHCKIYIEQESKEAHLEFVGETIGECLLNGNAMKLASPQALLHGAKFTVGDRVFKWEYPADSPLATSKRIQEPKKSPMPRILTPKNRLTKEMVQKPFNEAMNVASKAIEAAVSAVIPSPQVQKTPKQALASVLNTPSSKRVSFGPYVSPEIIDKTLPPSTPVKKGAEPFNLCLEVNQPSPRMVSSSTPKLPQANTPTTLLKRSLKKKVSQQPANGIMRKELSPIPHMPVPSISISTPGNDDERKVKDASKSSPRYTASKPAKGGISPKSPKRKSTFRAQGIERKETSPISHNDISAQGEASPKYLKRKSSTFKTQEATRKEQSPIPNVENPGTRSASKSLKLKSLAFTPQRNTKSPRLARLDNDVSIFDENSIYFTPSTVLRTSSKRVRPESPIPTASRTAHAMSKSSNNNTSISKRPRISVTPKLGKSPVMRDVNSSMVFSEDITPKIDELKLMAETSKDKKTRSLIGTKDMLADSKVQATPKMGGIRKVMALEKMAKSPGMSGTKKTITAKGQETPKMYGIKEMLTTPKRPKTPNYTGVKEMMIEPKTQVTPKMAGIKELMAIPKAAKSPNMSGIKQMMVTPKDQGTPKLYGIKEMLRTPKSHKTPNYTGLKEIMIEPKPEVTPRMAGIKELLASPKTPKSPDLRGIKEMMALPQDQTTPKFYGIREMLATPKVEETPNYKGIKEMMCEPKLKDTPKMVGIKELMALPKTPKSPDMRGVKELLNVPKDYKTPRMDGLKRMLAEPKSVQSPELSGIAEMMASPDIKVTPESTQPAEDCPKGSNISINAKDEILEERDLPQNPSNKDVGKASKRKKQALDMPVESNVEQEPTPRSTRQKIKVGADLSIVKTTEDCPKGSNISLNAKEEILEEGDLSQNPNNKDVGKASKRKKQALDMPLESNVEQKPTPRSTRQKIKVGADLSIVKTTEDCPKGSNISINAKDEILEEGDLSPNPSNKDVGKASKRKKQALDMPLELNVEQKPTQRSTRQKIKVGADLSIVKATEDCPKGSNISINAKDEILGELSQNPSNKDVGKTSKRKKQAPDMPLESDVEQKPTPRSTRQKIKVGANLSIVKTTEDCPNGSNVSENTEMEMPSNGDAANKKRVTRNRGTQIKAEKSESPNKSLRSQKRKKETTSTSPPAKRVTRSQNRKIAT